MDVREIDAGDQGADEADVRLGVQSVLGEPSRQYVSGQCALTRVSEERVLSRGGEGVRGGVEQDACQGRRGRRGRGRRSGMLQEGRGGNIRV